MRYSRVIPAILAAGALGLVASSSTDVSASTRNEQSSLSRTFPVVREAGPGAEQYTAYYPADPKAVGHDLPIVVFGNGACNHASDIEYITTLELVASHGFLVVSEGYYAGAPAGVSNAPDPSLLTKAIDWAQAQDRAHGSDLRHHVDTSSIAVAGHSCGGIEALVAGEDPRVDAVLALDTGFFPTSAPFGYGRDELAKLHSPVLFLDGGPDDIAYENSVANYGLVTVPAIHATNPDAGHAGFWHNTRKMQWDMTLTPEAATVIVQFLDLALYGNQGADAYFRGAHPGLAAVPGWSVESKDFPTS
ncbi:chlorophyllase-like protein [Motilibacter rhizosphaerae]|uniref:Chlorophyllase-like protein n=1 Tax=Motilibacter rhizosphaerae TaxID=598652 RepID=A0A4V2F567_9ACTN|nr:alpha/beta family hydrolase [Motilibacter rhizosphaerae]RZS91759.1 chlorophyllase-like protein [Motilibacter rhizosphaerae]